MTKPSHAGHARKLSTLEILGSVKEIIVFLVSAFILVAVFRGFIAEGYCIPTGSMAPSLYGLHQTRTCGDCGFEYAYNILQIPNAEGQLVTSGPRATVCPNCQFAEDPLPLEEKGRGLLQRGDQIFVLKLGFELADLVPGLRRYCGPQRWDVVVFKDPSDPTLSFIKRLIGLPGEKIEIIDGDVYINDRIARKTPAAAQSLWLPVYDTDYPPARKGKIDPRDLPGWIPLAPADADVWTAAGRKLVFAARGRTGTVSFSKPVRDYYAYDDPDYPFNAQNIVSDLKIQFVLLPRRGTGELRLVFSKWNDVFTVRICSAGTVELRRAALADMEAGKPGEQTLAVRPIPALKPGVSRQFTFENADYRLRLTLDGQTLLETSDAQYYPDIKTLKTTFARERSPLVRLVAQDLEGELCHVKLMRDIYYQSTTFIESRNKSGEINPLYGRPGHGTTRNPLLLGPHDYFVLGDNSPMSKDSRTWWEVGPHLAGHYQQGTYRLGTVPADQMVGKAFIVYLPAPFRVFLSGPAVIPNLGEVRFIR
jgi:signal peptidase I